MQATGLRKGNAIMFRGELYIVFDFKHTTPGKGRAFVQASLRNVLSGKIIQHKFSSTETIERVILEQKACQFLYSDDQGFHFMEMESYESFIFSADQIGDAKYFLLDNMEVRFNFHGEKPITPEFPKSVTLTVTDSPPGVKGDSVSNNLKPAVCETGFKVQVPLFIKEGEKININTETGEYQGRA